MGAAENNPYPIFRTVRCKGCGCLVEARFRSGPEWAVKDRVYCGKPCFSRHAKIQPGIVKVYQDRPVRPANSEYVMALRKHYGLEEI